MAISHPLPHAPAMSEVQRMTDMNAKRAATKCISYTALVCQPCWISCPFHQGPRTLSDSSFMGRTRQLCLHVVRTFLRVQAAVSWPDVTDKVGAWGHYHHERSRHHRPGQSGVYVEVEEFFFDTDKCQVGRASRDDIEGRVVDVVAAGLCEHVVDIRCTGCHGRRSITKVPQVGYIVTCTTTVTHASLPQPHLHSVAINFSNLWMNKKEFCFF